MGTRAGGHGEGGAGTRTFEPPLAGLEGAVLERADEPVGASSLAVTGCRELLRQLLGNMARCVYIGVWGCMYQQTLFSQ